LESAAPQRANHCGLSMNLRDDAHELRSTTSTSFGIVKNLGRQCDQRRAAENGDRRVVTGKTRDTDDGGDFGGSQSVRLPIKKDRGSLPWKWRQGGPQECRLRPFAKSWQANCRFVLATVCRQVAWETKVRTVWELANALLGSPREWFRSRWVKVRLSGRVSNSLKLLQLVPNAQ